MTRKAYNEQGIFNRLVQDTARRWAKTGLLTPEQAESVRQAFPTDFYEPHLFVKVALFLFTCFAVSGVSGVVFLFVSQGASGGSHSWEWRLLLGCMLCGVGTFVLLETLITSNHLYRSGVDNALLYCGLGYAGATLLSFYSLALPNFVDPEILLGRGVLWLYLLPLLVLVVLAAIRYADPVLGAVSFFLYLGIVVTLLLPSALGKALLPFGLMLACALAYQVVQWLTRRPDYLYYRTCVRTVKVLALACFYLAGNYLVVREVNALLLGLPNSVQISFAPLFYLFTVAIPLLYLYLGLRRADRIFLHTGLLALAFSLFTYRFYRSVLPPEWALTLGGAVLIVVAGWAMRYLRPARHGLTAEPADSPGLSILNLESVVMSHVAANTMQAPEPGFQFGGGSSGGGGAEGKY
ncbi:hypothetical protein E5K00_00605 [Hymenobacter aquaticus]|uniref:DUF2157 domain-containing protein n=1 Tax=Hymenobacter aquaticus TaxID=1867101 RepID=A0A4Z0Q185_9BACT|nr:hypothetical protein [Hymenobacter aquaticus]TGE23747.1 hypothetical protein E5K00_00605 [Hymenobacter aquaticus]